MLRNRKTKKIAWSTEEETKLFKMARNKTTFEELKSEFPNRTLVAIKDKFYRMGFKNEHIRT
ncbi:hypothetical protein KUL118_01080 [Tenacibaculum sp. KUL118]|nr:hypothetical protein KUL118_01080 [Tenacibaculum sp. KUL118]